ncbi:hypothetical protein QQP08_023421 [Theobroma cacao]|uniref:Uncharacterized protein n=1 Tax=Theobroma cacao TaxID=3641 RepID=A0A061FIQ3_THECC|nr:Uncharacterized protein TCM_033771 [Theobroma cacao]WRX30934.1 hypothetical protein QQP08_023421 [Theobroma cacao]
MATLTLRLWIQLQERRGLARRLSSPNVDDEAFRLSSKLIRRGKSQWAHCQHANSVLFADSGMVMVQQPVNGPTSPIASLVWAKSWPFDPSLIRCIECGTCLNMGHSGFWSFLCFELYTGEEVALTYEPNRRLQKKPPHGLPLSKIRGPRGQLFLRKLLYAEEGKHSSLSS